MRERRAREDREGVRLSVVQGECGSEGVVKGAEGVIRMKGVDGGRGEVAGRRKRREEKGEGKVSATRRARGEGRRDVRTAFPSQVMVVMLHLDWVLGPPSTSLRAPRPASSPRPLASPPSARP